MPKIVLRKEPRLDCKYQAYAYQTNAVAALRDLEFGAVFHEQGLGKTKIAIDLMLYWLHQRLVDTVLFVVKKGLIRNWERELQAHTYLRPKLLTQDRRNNYLVLNSPSRLILTHYEVVVSEHARLALFLRTRDVGVILDEATKIKNPSSTTAKAFFDLAPRFKRRVIMTGTPIANRPYDLWAQVWFLDQGVSLGTSFPDFKRAANLSNDLASNSQRRNSFEETLAALHSRIARFAVRETKAGGVIQLPEKVVEAVPAEWEPEQLRLYEKVRKQTWAEIVHNGVPLRDDSDELVKRLTRLLQIASNPYLVDESYNAEPGKLAPTERIVKQIMDAKEKCILWTGFVDNVEWLAKKFRSFGTVRIHGRMKQDDRETSLQQFLHKPDANILIATPGSAKEGLTLTVANHVLFYDRSFSLDDYLQAQDRIHRISQKKVCHVYNVIMHNSIDEWIDYLLDAKHLAAQLAQGDISEEQYASRMSYDYGEIVHDILSSGAEA